ncbi:MAG TPA: hypothetical protein VN717_10885 [Gemmatimonadaceae bacterium]|nr:hypothetical protein [Gemmatimonadaceae bacterium]
MTSTFARLTVVTAMIAGIAACSHAAKHAGDRDDVRLTTRVHVENRAFLDMNVFVISDGGGRTRLGTVTGNTDQDFVIPDYIVGPANSVRFLVEPIGSNRAPISNSLSVRPGETVTLTIPPNG